MSMILTERDEMLHMLEQARRALAYASVRYNDESLNREYEELNQYIQLKTKEDKK